MSSTTYKIKIQPIYLQPKKYEFIHCKLKKTTNNPSTILRLVKNEQVKGLL